MYWRAGYQYNLKLIRKASRILSKPFRFEFPLEEIAPKMKVRDNTEKYMSLVNEWDEVSSKGAYAMRFVDYRKSKGNFLYDTDGNRILDLTGHNGMNALGYNHPALVSERCGRAFHKYLNQLQNNAEYPSTDFTDLVRNHVMPYAPKGLSEVYFTDGLGTLANETAIKLALLKYKETHDGLNEIDWDNFASNDLSNTSSLLQNNVSVLGFDYATHGTTLATESAGGLC